MKLILEIHHHGDDEQAQYAVCEHFPITLGRAFDNDVILPDPYVSAHHMRISLENGDYVATDLGGENGFSLAGHHHTRHATFNPGDTLKLGHTEVRLYLPDHPVPAAIPLHRDSPFFAWINKPLNVWLCVVAALAATLSWAYLEIWSEEEGRALAAAGAATVAFMTLWAGLWSAAGRLARHKASFSGHMALIGLYLIAGTLTWYVEAYVDFLTNEGWTARLVSYGFNFILLAWLLYGSFTLATRMPHRRRVKSASFISFGVIAGIFGFTVVSANNFNQQPLYPSTLEPYLANLAAADTPEGFMQGNDALFASDEFADEPDDLSAESKPAKPAGGTK